MAATIMQALDTTIANVAIAAERGATLSMSGVALRSAMARIHSVQADTVTLPKGADRDPRMIWFPLVLVFDGKRCLTGIYELEKLDKLTTTCATGNPTFADVLGADAKPPFAPGKVLVLVAVGMTRTQIFLFAPFGEYLTALETIFSTTCMDATSSA